VTAIADPTARKRKKERWIVLGGALALFGIWIAWEWLALRAAVPSAAAETFDGWITWQAQPRQFILLPDESHLLALGPLVGPLPSGPSAYVFDSSGRLVDWTTDMGDAPRFEKKWSVVYPLQIVDEEQARSWLKARAGDALN
jgi:hypothetical protein